MTFKIQKSTERGHVVLTLSGRINEGLAQELREQIKIESVNAVITLDLKEVQLVDRGVVRFLAQSEMDGIKLQNCPPYIREWIHRERQRA